MGTFNSKFYITLCAVSAEHTSFFQPLPLTGLSNRSGLSLHGTLRSSSEAQLLCTFALGSRIHSQYGINVMYSSRVYNTKIWLYCEQMTRPKASVHNIAFHYG